jgi:uncharacterized damage-inducible protein DinB
MENAHQLAHRLQEVLLNGKWIANTNYQDQLSDLDWKQATQKIGSLNTIALLTYHINYYLAGILNVFNGGPLEIRDKYSFDLPPIESAEDWEKLKKEITANSETFVQKVEAMTEEQLSAPFVDEKYGSYRRNIEGVIEHSYYHLGQVSLIKKLVKESGI